MGDYDYVRKRKCGVDRTKCEKKKRRIVPEDCDSENCKKQCQEQKDDPIGGVGCVLPFLSYECKKHPYEDCPPMKITPVPTDTFIDVSSFTSFL